MWMMSSMPCAIPTTTIVATVILVVVLARPSSSQTFVASGRDTLRGLPGMEVEVENLEQDVERDGLTRAAIQSDVVSRLQAAGVTVYASQTANPSAAKPYLYVHVNSLKLATTGLYAMNVEVHVRQTVRSVATASNIVDAMTWDHSDVIVVPVSQVAGVRTVIQGYVDDLIQDWKAVH